MNSINCSGFGVVVVVAVMTASVANAGVAQVVGGLTTSATISEIFNGLDGLVTKSRDAGDYLTMRAAMEAKSAIESWKVANAGLLDKAFSSLDESQRQMFNNTRQLTERATNDFGNGLDTVQPLINQANQILESIPGKGRNTYVTRFYPRVKPAQTASSMVLRINGVNLDRGDPILKLGSEEADRMMVGPMEVQFTIPASAVRGEEKKLSIIPLTLIYSSPKEGFFNRLFGRREETQRELPIIALPASLGSFVFDIDTNKEEKATRSFVSQEQTFRGKNENARNIAKPLDGWHWDWSQGVGAFSQVGGGGEAGSCNGILESESTQDGIVHSAHLDMIKQFSIPNIVYGPGWQNCAVSGPIYQIIKVAAKLPTQSGSVTWVNDVKLSFPPEASKVSLSVTTFDGRTRLFSDTGADKFFDVIRGREEIVIRPRQPTDL